MERIEELRAFRKRCWAFSADEIEEEIEKYRVAAEGDSTEIQKIEYLLIRLKMFQAISRRMGSKELEDMYQKLVEQPWEHDESFPSAYKIEIIHDLLLLFNGFRHYSR